MGDRTQAGGRKQLPLKRVDEDTIGCIKKGNKEAERKITRAWNITKNQVLTKTKLGLCTFAFLKTLFFDFTR